jgi:hypothetical protein
MLNNKKFIFIILLFSLFLNNTFINSYIIYKNDYQARLNKYGGFCEPEGYGFLKFIYQKYNPKYNPQVRNYNDLPDISAYFYKFNLKNNDNYIILIGINDLDFNTLYKNRYKIIEKRETCYFVKKNA